jgi:hypothetical protein
MCLKKNFNLVKKSLFFDICDFFTRGKLIKIAKN